MQRQYTQLKRQYPDAILMFRLGDFYEMFNEDAQVASRALDIVLTARGEGVDKWPMCGVPYHAVDSYVAKLLQAGYTVAVANQLEDPALAKGIVKRDVVRVITPGTVLEPTMLDDAKNNYLMALVEHSGTVGIVTVDVSTGEFIATELPGPPNGERVANEISRLSPSEILIPDTLAKEQTLISALDQIGLRVTTRADTEFSARTGDERLREHLGATTLEGYGIQTMRAAIGAAGAILSYLQEVHRASRVSISALRTYSTDQFMTVDATTQRNLELVKNARDGTVRGTLLSVLGETVTPMGKRLLKQWILQPLMSIPDIEHRLDAVEELSRAAITRREIAEQLRQFGDLERTTGRIVFGSGNARDLLALAASLSRLPPLRETLTSCKSEALVRLFSVVDPLATLRDTLRAAIVDDPPFSTREGGMIRPGFNRELDDLRESISSDKKWIAALQAKERMRTGIKSLRVGYNKVFGYYIEVSRSNLGQVPDDYDRKQTLANAERFITPELKERESAVLAGEERINKLELEVFEQLRTLVQESADSLRADANAVGTVDVFGSLAEVAVRRRYFRPKLTPGSRIKIVDGRHPSLEMMLGANEFVPNSIEIGDGGSTLIIVTGPNMAGKSTYLRQVALIVLLAQMGSFVPAKEAEIGIADRIFTRVGAFDDLTARQSTFMVEMIETANILNNATDKSLVVLDEIGRGTSTYDGMALAWAVAERIVQMKTRTLFATHFHKLTDMVQSYHGVKNMHTLARETGDGIVFLHKVVDGATDKSYGVQVAALAGIPQPVVKRAKELLSKMEQDGPAVVSPVTAGETSFQTSLEPMVSDDPVVEKLRHMDLDRTTPIGALLELRDLQDEIRRRRK